VQFRKNVALEIIWGNKLVRRTGLAGLLRLGPLASFLLADPMAGKEFELTVGQITGQSHCSGKLQGENLVWTEKHNALFSGGWMSFCLLSYLQSELMSPGFWPGLAGYGCGHLAKGCSLYLRHVNVISQIFMRLFSGWSSARSSL